MTTKYTNTWHLKIFKKYTAQIRSLYDMVGEWNKVCFIISIAKYYIVNTPKQMLWVVANYELKMLRCQLHRYYFDKKIKQIGWSN